ncbi:MAG: hypothetical protein HYZ53_13325 [Planctomycetes bacterium]|nr:hypothetical protein [Planctomycetota bacterium]
MAATEDAPRDRTPSARPRPPQKGGAPPPKGGSGARPPAAGASSARGAGPRTGVVKKAVEVSFAEVDESEFEQASRVVPPKKPARSSSAAPARSSGAAPARSSAAGAGAKPGASRAGKGSGPAPAAGPEAASPGRSGGASKLGKTDPRRTTGGAPGLAAGGGEEGLNLKEQPRITLILGTGAILGVLFVCLIILNQATTVSTVEVALEMRAGEIQVRHETWKEGNPVFDILSSDPEVVEAKPFLYQEESDMVHFLIVAKTEGQSDVQLVYNNKDSKLYHVKVEPKPKLKSDWLDLKKEQLLERVRGTIQLADDFHRDGSKSLDNYYKAVKNYKLAVQMLKSVRMYNYLPEYKDVSEKLRVAEKDLDDVYNKCDAEYQVAVDRELNAKARPLLEVLLKIIPDEGDERYHKNKTLLEYKHQ